MLSHVKLAAALPSCPASPDLIKLATADDLTIRQIDQLQRFAERNSWRNGLDDKSGHILEPYRLSLSARLCARRNGISLPPTPVHRPLAPTRAFPGAGILRFWAICFRNYLSRLGDVQVSA